VIFVSFVYGVLHAELTD